MTSHTTKSFRDALAKLPKNIRARARNTYRRFRTDPHHSSLHFKKVHRTRPVYSARINDDYRVVGIMEDNEVVWFWIGKHEEYERLLKQL
jgi:mRNA-degrading endonuclease RelE of RelBE toxin-antitoxin system